MAEKNLEKILKPIIDKVRQSGNMTIELENHNDTLTEAELNKYFSKNQIKGIIMYDSQSKVYHIHLYQR